VVVRTLTYPGGTTGFGAQLQEVVRLAPSGLVVLLPQGDRDVELLAPQLVFYGVREVEGMVLFGNEAWTLDSVLESLQAPLTNGVLAVSSWPEVGEFGPGWSEFVSAYEETFRRTLRTPTPALGYDAARLLLTAARLGGGTPEGTLRALQEVREFPGATGVFSVIDGRIVRRYFPVRIEDRRLVPLSP
jgi:ABC-type branched-subunit amino acid transport system substrate-binding protein